MSHIQAGFSLIDSITPLVKHFPNYALNDLSKANLMNRIDIKYLVPLSFLPTLLAQLQSCYSVLEIDGHRVFTYENLYFDTDDFQFYQMHHNGKLNRFKVRHRKYIETQTNFLEVKFKNNKKRTVKTRMEIGNNSHEMTKTMKQFLQQHLKGEFSDLQPKQFGRYHRITLANEQLGERVTFDFGLSFQQKSGKIRQTLDGILIAELKQEHKNVTSPFFKLMRQYNIRPNSFSKYCIGCCLTYADRLRTNNFKHNLLKLKSSVINQGSYHV